MGKNKSVSLATSRSVPKFVASKRLRRKSVPLDDADKERVHLELKNYLQMRRLVVERSLNPAVRAEVKKLDIYLNYLRLYDF